MSPSRARIGFCTLTLAALAVPHAFPAESGTGGAKAEARPAPSSVSNVRYHSKEAQEVVAGLIHAGMNGAPLHTYEALIARGSKEALFLQKLGDETKRMAEYHRMLAKELRENEKDERGALEAEHEAQKSDFMAIAIQAQYNPFWAEIVLPLQNLLAVSQKMENCMRVAGIEKGYSAKKLTSRIARELAQKNQAFIDCPSPTEQDMERLRKTLSEYVGQITQAFGTFDQGGSDPESALGKTQAEQFRKMVVAETRRMLVGTMAEVQAKYVDTTPRGFSEYLDQQARAIYPDELPAPVPTSRMGGMPTQRIDRSAQREKWKASIEANPALKAALEEQLRAQPGASKKAEVRRKFFTETRALLKHLHQTNQDLSRAGYAVSRLHDHLIQGEWAKAEKPVHSPEQRSQLEAELQPYLVLRSGPEAASSIVAAARRQQGFGEVYRGVRIDSRLGYRNPVERVLNGGDYLGLDPAAQARYQPALHGLAIPQGSVPGDMASLRYLLKSRYGIWHPAWNRSQSGQLQQQVQHMPAEKVLEWELSTLVDPSQKAELPAQLAPEYLNALDDILLRKGFVTQGPGGAFRPSQRPVTREALAQAVQDAFTRVPLSQAPGSEPVTLASSARDRLVRLENQRLQAQDGIGTRFFILPDNLERRSSLVNAGIHHENDYTDQEMEAGIQAFLKSAREELKNLDALESQSDAEDAIQHAVALNPYAVQQVLAKHPEFAGMACRLALQAAADTQSSKTRAKWMSIGAAGLAGVALLIPGLQALGVVGAAPILGGAAGLATLGATGLSAVSMVEEASVAYEAYQSAQSTRRYLLATGQGDPKKIEELHDDYVNYTTLALLDGITLPFGAWHSVGAVTDVAELVRRRDLLKQLVSGKKVSNQIILESNAPIQVKDSFKLNADDVVMVESAETGLQLGIVKRASDNKIFIQSKQDLEIFGTIQRGESELMLVGERLPAQARAIGMASDDPLAVGKWGPDRPYIAIGHGRVEEAVDPWPVRLFLYKDPPKTILHGQTAWEKTKTAGSKALYGFEKFDPGQLAFNVTKPLLRGRDYRLWIRLGGSLYLFNKTKELVRDTIGEARRTDNELWFDPRNEDILEDYLAGKTGLVDSLGRIKARERQRLGFVDDMNQWKDRSENPRVQEELLKVADSGKYSDILGYYEDFKKGAFIQDASFPARIHDAKGFSEIKTLKIQRTDDSPLHHSNYEKYQALKINRDLVIEQAQVDQWIPEKGEVDRLNLASSTQGRWYRQELVNRYPHRLSKEELKALIIEDLETQAIYQLARISQSKIYLDGKEYGLDQIRKSRLREIEAQNPRRPATR